MNKNQNCFSRKLKYRINEYWDIFNYLMRRRNAFTISNDT